MPDELTFAEKLRALSARCGYVSKDSTNTFHKYRYASAAKILGAINEAMADLGLVVTGVRPDVLSSEGHGKDRLVTVNLMVTLADVADLKQCVTFSGLGSGQDSGDKAVMKASTAALKYAWMAFLSISTGDDPEGDPETDNRAHGKGKPEPEPEPGPDPDASGLFGPPPPSPVVAAFLKAVAEIELPGEGVAVWMKHRSSLASESTTVRETAWKALYSKVEQVGKMKNAKVWLKKAIAEEDARRNQS